MSEPKFIDASRVTHLFGGKMPENPYSPSAKGAGPEPSPVRTPRAESLEPIFADGDSKAVTGLNKTEMRFYEILQSRERRGEISKVRVHSFTLRLANMVRYTPDFSAITAGRMVLYEVKGAFVREDAWIKLKVTAALYPEIDFVMAQEIKGRFQETLIPK